MMISIMKDKDSHQMFNLFPSKKSHKQAREKIILLGLIEYYLKTGKPVGSNALKEAGFENLSSATIRNYFAHLEKEGYLIQQHASAGRLPSALAYRLYAKEYSSQDQISLSPHEETLLYQISQTETREIATFLQQSADLLSSLTTSAIFLSAPRFDHDFISEIKLIAIDSMRCLCVIITDFGVIQTELLPTEKKLTSFTTKRLENYFHWRLTGNDQPENLSREEEQLAQKYYNELMVRYIVNYSNFTHDEIHRTGFSKLLAYPEFQNPVTLSSSLALFESTQSMRLLLKECQAINGLRFWIGEDLAPFNSDTLCCSVLTIPFYINQQPVGGIGLLGTIRMPYRKLFEILRVFSKNISLALTRNIFKNKISFRQPQTATSTPYLQKEECRLEQGHLLAQSQLMLLEDRRNSYDTI